MVQGVLFDLDGVIYNGDEPIPGAAAAVESVRSSGLPSLFVTNTTSRSRVALAHKLEGLGVRASAAEILTPAVAAVAWIRSRGPGLAALFAPAVAQADFGDLAASGGEGSADLRYVVIGDLGAAWDYRTLNHAFQLLHDRPERALVALGYTRYWQAPDGPRLDVAPFVAALECATGRKAVVMGKPAPEFFLQAAKQLGLPSGEVLMVGDDLRVDALGAKRAGLRSALVKTGKFRPSDLEGDERPDWILDSVRDLPAALAGGGEGFR